MGSFSARKFFLLPVRLYKKYISPAIGSHCIYEPTCSTYFIQAVEKHGIIKGTVLGTDRILRCSRFYLGGPDPVPEKFSFKEIHNNHIRFRRHVRMK